MSKTIDYEITAEMIKKAKAAGACKSAIEWLEKKPRTWQELKQHNTGWAVWAMVEMPDLPIDLAGLSGWERAQVMAERPDCPINLTGLDCWVRAWVLRERGVEESA